MFWTFKFCLGVDIFAFFGSQTVLGVFFYKSYVHTHLTQKHTIITFPHGTNLLMRLQSFEKLLKWSTHKY
jgi:hypothetical protein